MSTVAVVGLGYVGLPLVVEFGKIRRAIGFDVDKRKVQSCQMGRDPSREISDKQMAEASLAEYTDDPVRLAEADFILVAVPTPVDDTHVPDLTCLIGASETVGRYMKRGCIVVFESTVYPGATEEVCIPALEAASGMRWKQDFFVGYSPERINPGDREHVLPSVVKVVSGDCAATLDAISSLYSEIVHPGVYRCSSIQVAEACKVIENTQRDLNIALMNELSIIFGKLGIDTDEVLTAANTKWNFLKFVPGLVGGHCIGVDPYYLTHKAKKLGYQPQVILAGRQINDNMGKYIAEQTIKQMISAGSYIKGARVIILGLTFKENCPDLRNSKVIDVVGELNMYGVETYVYDPHADPDEAMQTYGIKLTSWDDLPRSDAIVAAVAHRSIVSIDHEDIHRKLLRGGCFIDIKSAFDRKRLEADGIQVWRL